MNDVKEVNDKNEYEVFLTPNQFLRLRTLYAFLRMLVSALDEVLEENRERKVDENE